MKINRDLQQKEKILTPEFHQYRKSLRILKVLNEIEHTESKEEVKKLSELIQGFNKMREVTWPITDHSQTQNISDINWQS